MTEPVLVCVTGQASGRRLIHLGAALAQRLMLPLLVLSVSGSGLNVVEDPQVSQALNELYRISSEVGAEMTMLHDPDALHAISRFARERGVRHVVLGEGKGSTAFVEALQRELPKAAFLVAPAGDDPAV